MAPLYTLTYFNCRGALEGARYLCKYGDIKFDDIRVEIAEWSKIKNQTLFGQLPMLEYNGKIVNQSVAICRYLGKQVNLSGNDDWENLEIDAIADTTNDIRLKIDAIHREAEYAKRKVLLEKIIKETIPFYLSRYEEIATKNNGYLAIGRLTWADFHFAAFRIAFEKLMGIYVFDKYPTLKALIDKVENMPPIKKWIEERPKTEI